MNKRIKLCALLLVLCVAVCLSLTGCPRACAPSILDFADDDFAQLCGEIFDKDYKRVTAEDMASIESFGILTYGEDNTVSVGFTGSIENPTDTNTKVIDITGLIFDSFDDFAYLTNLRVFTSTYTTNSDYSFLANCKELEVISIYGNSECRGFDFLAELPKLYSFTLESGVIEDLSVFDSMTGLRQLSLNSVSTKIDPDYLLREEGTTIEELGYDEAMIMELSFLKNLVNLEELSITSGLIDDLSPLTGLSKLRRLDLSYNSIADVTPIAQLAGSLEFVDLTQSILSDVSPLAQLDENKITKIILDLCYGIEDWSPLDKFDPSQIQGRPTGNEK
ncbi:MAG: leucine-rich repeat domain-containing protein [Ruminococcaceae bacterium]|nr:leucine-rich repeat domain-containing protein [Oscillospiraceae bacterium]